jgi:Diadenosine tetraphosphate (Ap4A) hydrolase and other HIT family hydrolases
MDDCLFCKIAAGKIPSRKVFEDDSMLAFYDIDPKAPVHFLVIPKKHIANLMELSEGDAELIGRMVYKAQELARELGCGERGGRFVFNCKADGGQSVNHVHLHVLGGRALDWPPG